MFAQFFSCFGRPALALLTALLVAPLSAAQLDSTLIPTQNASWSANGGWLIGNVNGKGIALYERFLGGWAWAPNFGWVDLGDGSPANGYAYSQASATDCGVNVSVEGRLEGYAWAPNIGWIRFEQTYGQPHVDFGSGVFSGYAWSPNIGWIHLGPGPSQMVADSLAPNDSDLDGLEDSWEWLHFGDLTSTDGSGDADTDGSLDSAEEAANTDPNDRLNRLALVRIERTASSPISDTFALEWNSRPNRFYDVTLVDALGDTFTVDGANTNIPGSQVNATTETSVMRGSSAFPVFYRVEARRPFAP
jgi:hypothetical protein